MPQRSERWQSWDVGGTSWGGVKCDGFGQLLYDLWVGPQQLLFLLFRILVMTWAVLSFHLVLTLISSVLHAEKIGAYQQGQKLPHF